MKKYKLHEHKRVLGIFIVLAFICSCGGIAVGMTLQHLSPDVVVMQEANVQATTTIAAMPAPTVVAAVATVEKPTSMPLPPAMPTVGPSPADVHYIEELNKCNMKDLPDTLGDIGTAASEHDVVALCSLSHKFETQVGELLGRWAALPQPEDGHLQSSHQFLGEALENFSSSAKALSLFCESDDVSTGTVFLTLSADYMEQGSNCLNQSADELGQYTP